MTTLRGERVTLRPAEPGDADALRAMRSEPEVARWWGPPEDGWPGDEDDVVMLAIEVEGELAGLIQFSEEPDPDARSADIDIFLTPRLHGRGLGTEAMNTLAAHLLGDRAHHRLTLWTDPGNARAIRAYEKAGFRPVGVTRYSARDTTTGEWRDELFMERVVPPRPEG